MPLKEQRSRISDWGLKSETSLCFYTPQSAIRNLSDIRFRDVSSHHTVAVKVIGVLAHGVLHHVAPVVLVSVIIVVLDQVLEFIIEVGRILGTPAETGQRLLGRHAADGPSGKSLD